MIILSEGSLERSRVCGHLEPKNLWTKTIGNIHKIVRSRPSNHENSSTLEKSISLIVLPFVVTLQI